MTEINEQNQKQSNEELIEKPLSDLKFSLQENKLNIQILPIGERFLCFNPSTT